ncbi:MAG: chorismate synthase [Lachnospira sp.]|nr:chorismate synthase [Lachnospira sp.]
MAGSTFGRYFRVTTWGESHGVSIGCIVDGCPAGLALCEEDIQPMLDRRKPGQSQFTTQRPESDTVHILSGVFEGKTTGAPIAMEIANQSQRPADYSQIAEVFRPGHADFTFQQKYGIRDYRGGGRSSGRETAARVAAGAVAAKLLAHFGIRVFAYSERIAGICVDAKRFSREERDKNCLYMPDADAAKRASAAIGEAKAASDSVGGVIGCFIDGLPVGLGEPVFDKFDANLAKAILSIGAVKGFEIGEGFHAADLRGSTDNDGFICTDGVIRKTSDHSGGTLGGMSDGGQVYFRAAVKPTPSIARAQQTVTNSGENVTICVHGRHDPVIVPRAVVVVEAMAALTTADLLLAGAAARLSALDKVYDR